jgi:acyl-CoA reductase-like NAD-dependent aldehyde dehydrogenase
MTAVAQNSMYVGGEWSEGSGSSGDVFDPATASVIASIPSATAADVKAALEATRGAQRPWARLAAPQRGADVRAIADLIADHAASLASMLVQEVGKPLAQAQGEVAFAESLLRYSAEWDRRLEGEILPGDTYVFSRDYPTVMRTVDDLAFGEIYINRTSGESVHAHHAGYKESGVGGEDGKWGMLRYTQIKTAYHHYG